MSQRPLVWPDTFPPRSGWSRFFIGVRWLGPDLSFFHALRTVQQNRTAEVLSVWLDDDRAIALFIGRLLQRFVGWPTPYFIPQDRLAVIAYGPHFQSMDDLLFGSFVNALNDTVAEGPVPDELWEALSTVTFGEAVARLRPYVAARALS